MSNEYCLLITLLTNDYTLFRILIKVNNDILSEVDAKYYKEPDIVEKLTNLIPLQYRTFTIVETDTVFISESFDLTNHT